MVDDGGAQKLPEQLTQNRRRPVAVSAPEQSGRRDGADDRGAQPPVDPTEAPRLPQPGPYIASLWGGRWRGEQGRAEKMLLTGQSGLTPIHTT